MRKSYLWLAGFFVLLAIVLIYSTNSGRTYQACFEKKCFDLEIASTPEERQSGLMHRESLEENRGMLFIFENSGEYPFWMKDTPIPLDIIWIDDKFNVVSIIEADPCEEEPCQVYDPRKKAQYVLEINQGLSKKYDILVGSPVRIV